MSFDTVIGLEVHIQLNTRSKAFCGDENTFGEEPNTHVSAVSLAHPGTLPVINSVQISKGIKLGLALDCLINETNYFDRKHYFYPDLPKGYQITQDGVPICTGGTLEIELEKEKKLIRIHHIHMEEDAGKTVHDIHEHYSLIDLNRAGTPLLELVTEPDLSSGEEVYQFIAELQKLLRFLDISDADMEKGSLRCDCNVSVKPAGSTVLGERCEIKNLNSKRFARDAVGLEARRQIDMIRQGIHFQKQTLHYDSSAKKTTIMREKEDAQDYRYFNDPDLPAIVLHPDYIEQIRASLPELPQEIKERLMTQYAFTEDYANQISQSPEILSIFESLKDAIGDHQLAANFCINQYLPYLSDLDIVKPSDRIDISRLTDFLMLIHTDKVNSSIANQQLWPLVLEHPDVSPENLANRIGIIKKSDQGFLDDLIHQVLENNPDKVLAYQKGKKGLLGFFIGQIMREAKGAADPKLLKTKMTDALNKAQ